MAPNQSSITTDGGTRRDCTKVLVDTLVSVQETSGSTESESECLDTRVEKLNLEEPIDDDAGLPYQLVQPRLDRRAVALLVHVRAVGGAWRLPIDQDAKTHRGSRRTRLQDKMKIACMELICDPPAGFMQHGSTVLHGPLPRQRPVIEPQLPWRRILSGPVSLSAVRCEVLGALESQV